MMDSDNYCGLSHLKNFNNLLIRVTNEKKTLQKWNIKKKKKRPAGEEWNAIKRF